MAADDDRDMELETEAPEDSDISEDEAVAEAEDEIGEKDGEAVEDVREAFEGSGKTSVWGDLGSPPRAQRLPAKVAVAGPSKSRQRRGADQYVAAQASVEPRSKRQRVSRGIGFNFDHHPNDDMIFGSGLDVNLKSEEEDVVIKAEEL